MTGSTFNPRTILLLVSILFAEIGVSQSILTRPLTLDIKKQRIDNVLEIIGNRENFYFSYNSNIIKRDSLVSFSVNNKTVKQVLDQLFPDDFEFIESGNYVILRKKPIATVAKQDIPDDRYYTITGHILNGETGENIRNASVYEKQQLTSVLSDENGYFKLKLKSRYSTANLTISKVFYKDTTVIVQPKFNQNISIAIIPVESEATIITVAPQDFSLPDTILFEVKKPAGTETYLYKRNHTITVEKSDFGKFLLSAKQKIRSLNLGNFFTTRPFQVSLVPGVSTQGKLNPQVIHNFSVNIFGGYSGGVNIAEVGGVFNIDKKNVQYIQVAGLSNIVGGDVTGIQAAGLSNTVLGNAKAGQFALAANTVNGDMRGAQFAGIYNHVLGTMNGIQAALISNFANNNLRGTQVSGAANISRKTVIGTQLSALLNYAGNVKGTQVACVANINKKEIKGTQIGGLFNYAHKIKGVQIGLINIADSIDGLSIGLLNISKNGYHKVSIGTSEAFDLNVAFKTGSHKLYSILLSSFNLKNKAKAYSFGFGVGRENRLGRLVAINTELTSQQIYLGTWQEKNILTRLQANVNLRPSKHFSLFAGPAYNAYYSTQTAAVEGYKFAINNSYKAHPITNDFTGWFGWNAGIHLF